MIFSVCNYTVTAQVAGKIIFAEVHTEPLSILIS